MFSLDGNNITLSRGDTLALGIQLKGRTVADGSTGLFTIKTSPRKEDAILIKEVEITDESAEILLEPEDTKDLPFKTFYWDFRVIDPDGNVSTPMDVAAFTIAEVVGDA